MADNIYQSVLKKENIALLIGNGINRFRENSNSLSWAALIRKLADERGFRLPV
ncbi:MAG: hypothetical protein NTX78_01195 [Rhodoluna sp.]|nr:hypothetical protein [Rhodoluna sp.]